MQAKPVIGGDPKKLLKASADRAASKKKNKGKSVSIFSREGSYRLSEQDANARRHNKGVRDTIAAAAAKKRTPGALKKKAAARSVVKALRDL